MILCVVSKTNAMDSKVLNNFYLTIIVSYKTKRNCSWKSPCTCSLSLSPSEISTACVHCESVKRRHHCPCLLSLSNIISFTVTLFRKFATKPSLKISAHLMLVATLPCEILMSYRPEWYVGNYHAER